MFAIISAALLSWSLFAQSESRRAGQVHAIRTSHSEVHVVMTIDHDRGPLLREEWRMNNVDGRSSALYAATDRRGRTVKVDAAMQNYDVAFLFDRVVQDGIWELGNRPPRGDTSNHYHVQVRQSVVEKSGSHDFTFTDPRYWATTGGRQYHITLDKQKPVPDLLKMTSTVLAEPRYAKVVADIESFGSPKFRSTVVRAKAELHVQS